MIYNPTIHHRRSITLKGYDYSQAGLYCITICCQDRAHLFGRITNGVMKLNDAGDVASQCWSDISDHFPNAVLHEYVIMPNHIHGIVELVGANNHSPTKQTSPKHSPTNHTSPNHSPTNQTSPNHSPANQTNPGHSAENQASPDHSSKNQTNENHLPKNKWMKTIRRK